VSYVLNDSDPVAADRRARVLDAIRVLNYTPNEWARSLKRLSASTIGPVVPELSNQFFALLAEGVERAASARDVLVVPCAPEVTRDSVAPNAQLLRSRRLDGVIYLSGAATSPSATLELTKLGPIVVVDEQVPGFDLPAVASDGRRGRREVAPHVLEQVLLCANDLMAIGALEYARSAGISVPEDVSIVGFDDIPFARLLTPRLTTVRQAAYDMGHRAATMLLDLLDGTTGLFPVTLEVRDSVAPLKAAQR
jgi:DNA-binding LacI/PurR family transcriptional regulator